MSLKNPLKYRLYQTYKKNWWQRVQNERNCCHRYRHRLLDDNSNDIFYRTVAQSQIPADKK